MWPYVLVILFLLKTIFYVRLFLCFRNSLHPSVKPTEIPHLDLKITEKGRAEEEGEGGRGRKKVSEGKEEGKRKIKKKRKGNIKI